MRCGPAIGLLVALPIVASAQPRESRAHMEACLRWSLAGNRFVTRNSCDTPVSIMFMTIYDGHVVTKDVAPGGRFDSDPLDANLTREMMFTACPAGYRPNLRFNTENAEPIRESLYNCVPPGKPTS
jgi:hypothetical protein